MLFVLGIAAMPVSAHFTMGNHQATYPFRTNHFDPHVQGLIGYVFPGSGLFTAGAPGWYTGSGTYPGYQSPWPYWTGGVNNPWPTQGPMGWYQLDANNYAPFGAILTSTIKAGTPFTTMWKANRWASDNPTIESLEIEHAVKGDMILAFNITASQKLAWFQAHGNWFSVNFTLAETLIPPEFSVGLSRRNVVTSFTNNYDNIEISTRNREDYMYGPYWRRLRIYTDTSFAGAFASDEFSLGKMDDMPDPMLAPNGPFQFSPWKALGNITFTIRPDGSGTYADEWYYIRINDMTAPTIAGAYMFKFRRLSSPELGSVYFPYQNWPVVLVKGEVDPAIITGTIRYGGWNTTLYGQPVTLPGRVRAVGIADDPYTGKTTGRPVEARGYFDAAWCGHYEVEGVAPGVYDIYASAAGYPEIKIASNVKILKGQSYHVDGYLVPGVQIRGSVFSKCGTGEIPWFNRQFMDPNHIYYEEERNIKIEIYRSLDDAQSMNPGGSTSKAVTWSPIDFGWDDWSAYSFYYTIGGFYEAATRVKRGVGPPPSPGWRVDGTGGNARFDFQFGREGYYGAPADLVGHVPGSGSSSTMSQAEWVSGIGAGTYYVRAWLYGYVQTEADGVTFLPVTFTVPSIEWPGNVWIPFDLRRSSEVQKTVHFHDVPGTLMESAIGWGWNHMGLIDGEREGYYRYLSAELVATGSSNYKNQAGEPIFAWKIRPIAVSASSATILLKGIKETGNYYGWGRNYGIPAGLYTAKAYMWGYVEQVFEKVNLGLCGTTTFISDHLYRGAKFNITIYSKDWQHPTADKYWSFPYMPIWVQISKDGKLVQFDQRLNYVMPYTMQGWGNTSVAVWPYMWNNPWFLLKTNDANAQVYGPDGPYIYRRDYFGPVPAGANYHFRYYDGSESYVQYYYMWGHGEGSTVGYYPLSFETGIYDFKALTYGYVQKKPVVVGATKGNATSDILIKLTQGAELELTIKFKHQGVFEAQGIPFDAHMRIRVLNDKNKLVGEYLTSDWWWQPQYEWSDNSLRYTWNLVRTVPAVNIGNARADPPIGHRGWWRLNYIPLGTTTVKVVIAGLPDLYNWAWAGGVGGAFWFGGDADDLSSVEQSCDPCGATGDFGYNKPIAAPYGIDAYPNYQGGWKIQVHVVPVFDYYPGHYYRAIEVSPTPGIGPYIVAPTDPIGFEGMLTGELTYTADMKPIYTNHLGPYELRYDVVVPGTHLGGESSLIFELDRRGLVTGSVFGYTWCDDWRSAAWTIVQFTAADGTVFTHYTFDGWFAAWLNAGPYTASVIYWKPAKQEGYKVQTMPYHVSDGALGAFNVYLELSYIPIPEFPAAATMLAFVLAASLFILRRRKK